MKKIIVTVGFIILGVYIYNMILGNTGSTLKTESKIIMDKQIQEYKITP